MNQGLGHGPRKLLVGGHQAQEKNSVPYRSVSPIDPLKRGRGGTLYGVGTVRPPHTMDVAFKDSGRCTVEAK